MSNPITVKQWVQAYQSPGSKSRVWVDQDLHDTQTLYRYIQWEPYGRKMFEDQVLFFRAPYKWVEPYEKRWCEQLFRGGSKLAKVNAYDRSGRTSLQRSFL